jgi:hypothetical protein
MKKLAALIAVTFAGPSATPSRSQDIQNATARGRSDETQ